MPVTQCLGCELQNLPNVLKDLRSCLKTLKVRGKLLFHCFKKTQVLDLDLAGRTAVLVGINWLMVAYLMKPLLICVRFESMKGLKY